MMTRMIASLLSALAVIACAQEPDTPQVGQNDAIDTITAAAIEEHLRYLADDAREGRMAGQPGHNEAAQYVADHFASLGLEPGGDDGWFQQVPLIAYRLDDESDHKCRHSDVA